MSILQISAIIYKNVYVKNAPTKSFHIKLFCHYNHFLKYNKKSSSQINKSFQKMSTVTLKS